MRKVLGGLLCLMVFIACEKDSSKEEMPDNNLVTNGSGTFVFDGDSYPLKSANFDQYAHELDASGRFHSLQIFGSTLSRNGDDDFQGSGMWLNLTFTKDKNSIGQIVGDYSDGRTWTDSNDSRTAPDNTWQDVEGSNIVNGSSTTEFWVNSISTFAIQNDSTGYYIYVEGNGGMDEGNGNERSGSFNISYRGAVIDRNEFVAPN